MSSDRVFFFFCLNPHALPLSFLVGSKLHRIEIERERKRMEDIRRRQEELEREKWGVGD